MYFRYDSDRSTAVVLSVTFGVIGVAGIVVGPVLIAKSKENHNEDYLIAGAIVTGEAGAMVLLCPIIGPVKATKAKRNRDKLAGMRTTALRSPRLVLVGVAPLVDRERSVSGLALSWEF
jgi:hypothetical protein